jgi:hypothetical protein
LNQEYVSHIHRTVTSNEIEAAIRCLPKKESPGPNRFIGEFYQTFKEILTPTLFKLFQEIERKEYCQTHYIKPVLNSSLIQIWTKNPTKITGQLL